MTGAFSWSVITTQAEATFTPNPVNSAGTHALFVDFRNDALFVADLSNGDVSIVSNSSTGSGPNLGAHPHSVVWVDTDRAVLVDGEREALLFVDLANGNRTLLSDKNTGDGPMYNDITDIALDSANSRLLVLDDRPYPRPDALLAIDLNTGDRIAVTDEDVGDGPDIVSGTSIMLEVGRALVADTTALMAVDPNDGTRTILASRASGKGREIEDIAFKLAFDDARNIATVIARARDEDHHMYFDALVAIDLENGSRAVLSDEEIGGGPRFEGPTSLVSDISNNRLIVTDVTMNAVLSVDITSGIRSILSSDNIGDGPMFKWPRDVAMGYNNKALVYSADERFFIVDLETGNRTLLTRVAEWPEDLYYPANLTLDCARNRALAMSTGPEDADTLYAFDLQNGEWTVVSDYETGSGPGLRYTTDLAMDDAHDRALLAVPGDLGEPIKTVMAVDLRNGDRSVVTDVNTGKGPPLDAPLGIASDSVNNRALVVSRPGVTLSLVDLVSGDRVIVSKSR